METLNIKLSFDPQNFWDMYYPNGQSSFFRNNNNRKVLLNTAISVSATAILYFASFKNPSISWMLVLGILATVGFAIYGSVEIMQFFKRKNQVDSFIKNLSKYSKFSITVTDQAIETMMDKEIIIEKWSSIKSVKMNENYLVLFNEAGACSIFPAKSMQPYEFMQLKEFTKNMVQ